VAIILSHDNLKLTCELAGERYRSSRFDWNGLVSSARWKGIELLGEEKPLFQRDPSRFGRALHNEFGIKTCIGYDEVAVGQWFPKIGTGWLKKDTKPYFFYNEYQMEALSFTADHDGANALIFSCLSGERNGYAYEYQKRISLADKGFAITYTLTNTGERSLQTDEYVHNFLCFAGKRMDRGYKLSFPWVINESLLGEKVNPDKALAPSGNTVECIRKTSKQFYLGGLSNGHASPSALWTLSHDGLGISLSEAGSFVPSAVHLWGWKRVISPEVFFSFSIARGETVSWERRYSVT